ncbi:MAG: fimbrillin family protein, partial [Alistipes sp.]|nr:fimbrillin family protein [Alistipes sp.]
MKIKQLTFALMALMLGSCATDPQELNVTVPFGAPQIHISGAIDNEQLSRVDESGFCEGDQVGLYGVNYTDNNATAGTLLDEGNQVDNARYTYSKQSGSWSSSGSFYYKDANTNIDLYAYYPFSHPQSVSAYEFAVERDQNSATGYAQSDFLWAKAEGIVPSENKVRLGFRHRLALVNVVLAQGAGFAEGEFESLSSSVLALNTTRTATIDLSTGVATATGEAEAEGIVMKAGEENFRAIVVPQSVNGGTALFAITLDGITYRFKRSEAVEYQAGKMHTFTIEISKKSTTGTYELNLINTAIEDWAADLENYGGEARQYFVVHLDEPGTLGQKIREANKNPNKIKNLKVSGKISKSDFYFMRDSMAILQAVNIKESKIVALWYYYVNLNDGNGYHYEYFEGEMP